MQVFTDTLDFMIYIDCTQFTFCSNLHEFLYPPWLTFAGVLPGLSCYGLCVLSAPTIIFCKMVIMERKNNRKKNQLAREMKQLDDMATFKQFLSAL
jgi:hypothetical protein